MFIRIENEEKLKEKVNEALTVFNEYVKTQGDGAGPDGGKPEDDKAHDGEQA